MLLFYTLFRLLAGPPTPRRACGRAPCWAPSASRRSSWAPRYLLVSTRGTAGVPGFGIALILLIWINYFSRVVMYAAAVGAHLGAGPGRA